MKTKPSLKPVFLYIAVLLCFSMFFQSCVPSNEVRPISAAPNTVTVKVKNENQVSSNEGQTTQHLLITTTDETQKVLLDTNITGSYTYSFKTLLPELNITATLTSTSPFLDDLEIDVNGEMHSYHGGSCPGTEYGITDYISF